MVSIQFWLSHSGKNTYEYIWTVLYVEEGEVLFYIKWSNIGIKSRSEMTLHKYLMWAVGSIKIKPFFEGLTKWTKSKSVTIGAASLRVEEGSFRPFSRMFMKQNHKIVYYWFFLSSNLDTFKAFILMNISFFLCGMYS